jgi:glycosyltransferase involved in cell wall biosynthesis/tetratricopeptide (TPR) repeat protein
MSDLEEVKYENPEKQPAGRRFEATLAQAIAGKDFQVIVKTIIGNSNSVLDIGCGIGDYLKYTNAKQRVVAIEPHQPYLEKAREAAPWVEFVNADALSYFENNSEKFDCVLMIDVIEHLEEPEARKLVALARQAANRFVFAQIPIGQHDQEEDMWNLGGEYWQTHRSVWSETAVAELGFNFYQIWRDWYDWDDAEKSRDTSIAIWSEHPLVSIVMPSYNQAEWLPKSLDSILAQTYPFWEAVVVNDGSTDNTAEVIADYAKRDSRIRGVHKPNGGISSALNRGIAEARGEYFCWLSSDDLFYPDKLQLQIDAFQKLDERYAIVFGQFDFTDPYDNVKEFNLTKPFIDGLEFPQTLKYDFIDGCTIMIPMRIMREVGGFNLQFKHAQDTELWMRLAAKDYRFFWLDHKLTLRRVHPNQGFTDFALDCRYDGNSMIDFYLQHYSLRDYYRHVDFNKKDDLWTFIKQFYNMLADPDCLINHVTLQNTFWQWFKQGLLTLEPPIRNQILDAGIYSFKEAKTKGQFWADYYQKLVDLSSQIKTRPREKYTRNDKFADITKFSRATDRHYSDIMLQHGELKYFKEGNLPEALTVFKYLCDYDNPNYAKAFDYFLRIVNTLGKHDTYLRSFRRKKPIRLFPDRVKAYYVWSKLQLGEPYPEVDDLIAGIADETLREKAASWKSSDKIARITPENIEKWNYWVDPKNVNHALAIRCPVCEKVGEYRYALPVSSDAQERTGICLDCFSAFKFSDSLLGDYFRGKVVMQDEHRMSNPASPRITYVMRYSNLIGGGVKKVYQHIQWLAQLGCRIKIYSLDDPPQWIKLPAEFVKVRDHYEDDFADADLVVVFTIYDVPKVLMKVPAERVVHICQGYEGYHLGESFEKMRADKYFYTTLHSLPVKNILVSKHLMRMFREKFGREGHYVPNGINLDDFYPDWNVGKEANSIAFIGNPSDKLKGVTFLLESLEKLQNSTARLSGVNLHIVWGGQNPGFDESFKKIPGLMIRYHNDLSGKQVAQLLRRMNLLAVTSWYEGFSLPVLEGMACGVPVITSNNMGAESFCQDGVNSFVVNYGDTSRFAGLIGNILGKRIFIGDMLAEGYRTVVEYSEKNSVTAFIAAFESLLKVEFQPSQKNTLISQATSSRDTAALQKEFRLRAEPELQSGVRTLLTLIRSGQIKRAANYVNFFKTYHGRQPEALFTQMLFFWTTRDFSQAWQYAEPLLPNVESFCQENYLHIGRDLILPTIYEVAVMVNAERALSDLEKTIEAVEEQTLWRGWLQVMVAIRSGDKGAASLITEFLEELPGFPPADKLRHLFTTGKKPDTDGLQTVIRENATDVYRYLFDLAGRALEENNPDLARSRFQRIQDETRGNIDGEYGLALCDCQQEKYTSAINHLRQIIGQNEFFAPAYNQLGVIAYSGSKFAEAAQWFETAIQYDPDYLDARRNQAETLFTLREYDLALKTFFAIVRDFPDDVPTLSRLAQVYHSANRLTEARGYAARVLALEPGNIEMVKIINR